MHHERDADLSDDSSEFGKGEDKGVLPGDKDAEFGTTVSTHQVTAYMFEMGCLGHSVLIGFTLGVNTDDRDAVVTMLFAYMFHQALEGLALGSFIVKAYFGTVKSVLMVCIYALTLPVGIAIGMGVASSYDEDSITSRAVQGVFNSFSGGLLLYIALAQMIAHDAMLAGTALTGGWIMRVLSYLALTVGIAAMAVIAIFEGDTHGH